MRIDTSSSTGTRAHGKRPATLRAVEAASDLKKKTRTHPFPDFFAPSSEEVRDAVKRLERLHGRPTRPAVRDGKSLRAACGETTSVLRALVATILSQNTTNKNSTAAMTSLMTTFGHCWESIWKAPQEKVAEAIRMGGLANVKAGRIQVILEQVRASEGTFTLDHLHEMDDATARQALLQYEGVGEKTAACVLLFCLRRESFAVDTHVYRIVKNLQWVPQTATRDQAYAHLERKIPAALKYRLHVLLVEHGKCCVRCAANGRPQRKPLGPCPLEGL